MEALLKAFLDARQRACTELGLTTVLTPWRQRGRAEQVKRLSFPCTANQLSARFQAYARALKTTVAAVTETDPRELLRRRLEKVELRHAGKLPCPDMLSAGKILVLTKRGKARTVELMKEIYFNDASREEADKVLQVLEALCERPLLRAVISVLTCNSTLKYVSTVSPKLLLDHAKKVFTRDVCMPFGAGGDLIAAIMLSFSILANPIGNVSSSMRFRKILNALRTPGTGIYEDFQKLLEGGAEDCCSNHSQSCKNCQRVGERMCELILSADRAAKISPPDSKKRRFDEPHPDVERQVEDISLVTTGSLRIPVQPLQKLPGLPCVEHAPQEPFHQQPDSSERPADNLQLLGQAAVAVLEPSIPAGQCQRRLEDSLADLADLAQLLESLEAVHVLDHSRNGNHLNKCFPRPLMYREKNPVNLVGSLAAAPAVPQVELELFGSDAVRLMDTYCETKAEKTPLRVVSPVSDFQVTNSQRMMHCTSSNLQTLKVAEDEGFAHFTKMFSSAGRVRLHLSPTEKLVAAFHSVYRGERGVVRGLLSRESELPRTAYNAFETHMFVARSLCMQNLCVAESAARIIKLELLGAGVSAQSNVSGLGALRCFGGFGTVRSVGLESKQPGCLTIFADLMSYKSNASPFNKDAMDQELIQSCLGPGRLSRLRKNNRAELQRMGLSAQWEPAKFTETLTEKSFSSPIVTRRTFFQLVASEPESDATTEERNVTFVSTPVIRGGKSQNSDGMRSRWALESFACACAKLGLNQSTEANVKPFFVEPSTDVRLHWTVPLSELTANKEISDFVNIHVPGIRTTAICLQPPGACHHGGFDRPGAFRLHLTLIPFGPSKKDKKTGNLDDVDLVFRVPPGSDGSCDRYCFRRQSHAESLQQTDGGALRPELFEREHERQELKTQDHYHRTVVDSSSPNDEFALHFDIRAFQASIGTN